MKTIRSIKEKVQPTYAQTISQIDAAGSIGHPKQLLLYYLKMHNYFFKCRPTIRILVPAFLNKPNNKTYQLIHIRICQLMPLFCKKCKIVVIKGMFS